MDVQQFNWFFDQKLFFIQHFSYNKFQFLNFFNIRFFTGAFLVEIKLLSAIDSFFNSRPFFCV